MQHWIDGWASISRGINNCFKKSKKIRWNHAQHQKYLSNIFPSVFFLLIQSIITSACRHTRIDFIILFTISLLFSFFILFFAVWVGIFISLYKIFLLEDR
jgi:hypothetical protein